MAAALFRKSKYSTLSTAGVQPPPLAVQPRHQPLQEAQKKKEIPEGLWEKCKKCDEIIYTKQRESNLNTCPRCGYHYPLTAQQRIDLLCDADSFKELFGSIEAVDSLKFESYAEKIVRDKTKTGLKDAIVCGAAKLNSRDFALGVMDFRFIGGSMGAVVGEKVSRLTEYATSNRLPLVLVTASGGARMHEGIISLMQMAKTSGVLQKHAAAGLPYITILTSPTTGGVTASFATLGDVLIAEPDATIAFAGARVIKDTTQAQLPEGFQTSEFLLKKGLIDRIVERKNLRAELALHLEYFAGACMVAKGAKAASK
jgi:acetyl-CoA carboxylase carboxyl transferase subunit beta